MFNWLKGRQPARKAPAERRPARPVPAKPAALRRPPAGAAPVPLPEVVSEGSTEADWSAWEDSMTALDSQMQGLMPTDRVYVRETRPSQLDDPQVDAFSSVKGKRDR